MLKPCHVEEIFYPNRRFHTARDEVARRIVHLVWKGVAVFLFALELCQSFADSGGVQESLGIPVGFLKT